MKTIGERFDEMAEVAGVSKNDKSYYFGRSCCFQIAAEQKSIDDAELTEVKRQRDEYYDELLSKRQRIAELEAKLAQTAEKACEWLKRLPPQWEVYEDAHYEIDRDSIIEELRKYLED